MGTMLARFAEASRKKQILAFDSFSLPRRFGMKPFSAGTDWAIPSFNFGDLDNVGHSPEAWSRAVWEETWRKGAKHISEGTFRLPFDECAYLFHYSETHARYESANLLHLVTSGDEIIGECYFWQPNAPGRMGQWTKDAWQFTIINGSGIEWAIEPNFERQLPMHVAADYHENAKASYSKVISATMLLGKGRGTSQSSEYVCGVNRGRALGKLAALPDTVSIRFDQAALSHAAGTGGTSGVRQPHNRRGHYRTLRCGRVVPVKPSKVHGGASQARTYLFGAA
jgi:hypothetical protein